MESIRRLSKKLFIAISSIITLILVFFFLMLFLLTTNPKAGIGLIDKLFINQYEISFEDIKLTNLLTYPNITASNLSISDKNQDININNLDIIFSLYSLILDKDLFLKKLHIDGYTAIDKKIIKSKKTKLNGRFSLSGEDLNIKSTQLTLRASNFSINSDTDNYSIKLKSGQLDNVSFLELDLLLNNKKEIYYSGIHKLFTDDLDQLKIINKSSFKFSDIKTNVISKGKIDIGNDKNNKGFFKIDIYDSNITFNSGYMVGSINASLYSNIDKGLYGRFTASLPLQDVIQDINGNILYLYDDGVELVSSFNIDMTKVIESNDYFSLSGKESFKTSLKITPDQMVSLSLDTDLINTNISSSINEITKPIGKPLVTSISIPDIVNPSYSITNELFEVYIEENAKNGFFAFGGINQNIEDKKEGFHIYLNLDLFDFSSVKFESNLESEEESFVKSISLQAKEFKMLNNSFKNQHINLNFDKKNLYGNFKGTSLNGSLVVDRTGFSKIILEDTSIENLNFISRNRSVSSNINDSSVINMRIQGKNIQIANEKFENIDFYILRNNNLITLENINIKSTYINVSPLASEEKAFMSYSFPDDQYKIKGLFKISGDSKLIQNSLNYDFEFLNSELSIQWNSIEDLRNLEGKVNFLTKNFTVENNISSSAFLNTLKVLNLDAIIKNIDSNNRRPSRDSLTLTRAAGDIIFSKKRGLISNPISIETDEAKMLWKGEIIKDNNGYLNDLNLDMSMRIKVSENLPWYAAILGGIPAVASTLVFQDLFEDNIDAASSVAFTVNGTIKDPELKRLD